jgi:hypothetical protein
MDKNQINLQTMCEMSDRELSNLLDGLRRIEGFTLEDIALTKTIYYEALTKQTFHDALNSVFNCLKFTRDTFALFGQSSINLTQ